MLVKACKAGFCKQLVVAGQKSGWLWALNPENGECLSRIPSTRALKSSWHDTVSCCWHRGPGALHLFLS